MAFMKDKKNSAILKGYGFKITPARLFVLNLFEKSGKPLSAEGIITKSVLEKINNVTIYRILTSFEEAKIIRRVDLRKDSTYYELASCHHHHLVCNRCGDIEDVEVCIPETLSKAVVKSSKKFSSIDDHSLEFFGICKNCSKQKK